MLQTFRKQSDKWFIKVLFGAIIASFMVWGIGDMLRTLSHDGSVAKVGSKSISQETYVESLQREVSQLQQRIQGKITPAQIQEIGLPQRILDQLIDNAALEQVLEQSRIAVPDEVLKQTVHSMEAFQQNNKFDAALFKNLLRHNNLTEKEFLKVIKQSLQQQQLFSPVTNSIGLPHFYQNLLFEILHQKKGFAVAIFPWGKVKLKSLPTAEEINSYYTNKKENYNNPERRHIRLIIIRSTDLLAKIPVTEAEIQKEYQNKAAQFIRAEKREVKSLTYSSEQQALEAAKVVNRGYSLERAAKIVPGGRYENLGLNEKASLAEVAAEPAFSLEINKASEIINTGFGYVFYQVSKVEPAVLLPLKEVKTKILNTLQAQKFGEGLQPLKNTLEDSLAEGVKLEEIAISHALKIETPSAFDKKGLTKEGKGALPALLNAAAKEKIIEQAFSLEENTTSSVIDLNDQECALVHVDKIERSYIPALTEIRNALEHDLVQEKKYEEGYQLIQTLCHSIQSEADLQRLAQHQGLTVKDRLTLSSAEWIEGEDSTKEKLKIYSQELISNALQTPLNQSILGLSSDHKFFIIMIPVRLEPFKSDDKKKQHFEKLLKDSTPESLRSLLLKSFRSNFKIKLNQSLLDKISS